MSVNKKRRRDETIQPRKGKKVKFSDDGTAQSSSEAHVPSLLTEEVDFPRGGGSSFTPLEYKAIQSEAKKEAESDLFQDAGSKKAKSKRPNKLTNGKPSAKPTTKGSDTIRVEHLNYKRLTVGTKILGQITAIRPLNLILSLPNQTMGHVPITQISDQLTEKLENLGDEGARSEGEDDEENNDIPDLMSLFEVGQYVRAVVTSIKPSGASATELGRSRDEAEKASKRVELSLVPAKVNDGVSKSDLVPGFTMSAAVQSVEDHGYILDLGLSDVNGFVSSRDSKKFRSTQLVVGQTIDTAVVKMSENGRTCNLSVDQESFKTKFIAEVTSVTSVLPGALVQTLITAIVPAGLNVQVLGYFEGTINLSHIGLVDLQTRFKIGQKIKARIIWDMPTSTPRRFALSVLPHIMSLGNPLVDKSTTIRDAFPVGTTLDAVKVIRVEAEGGLVVEIQSNVAGYVHISQVSDEHVPSLSGTSGPWKIGTVHVARVIGYCALDALLLVSLKPTVLKQAFLQVGDVRVGEFVKGTVKRLTDTAMFVSISGNVDGVIWPNHYADIKLKHPEKRFKEGALVKCRVLVVDPQRSRICLTAKRTLVESELPIISQISDAKVGMIVHAVVFRVADRSTSIEFYNNLRGVVPLGEASETQAQTAVGLFSVGQVLRVRIIAVDLQSNRITASVRQATPNFDTVDVNRVKAGQMVQGKVTEVHQDNIVLELQPTNIKALLSIPNLANHRDISAAALKGQLKVGETLTELVVVSLNAQKGLVIVANRPKGRSGLSGVLSIDNVQPGQILPGLVVKHGRRGASVRLSNKIYGSLHPTDTCDNYNTGMVLPAIDSLVKAAVIEVDREKKHAILSTRASRLRPDESHDIADQELSLKDLKVGDTVRGFVKSVADHGLFVSISRELDARIQIRHLFDEFVKDWKPRFHPNQLVTGRILNVSPDTKQVEMTLKTGDLTRISKASRSGLSDYDEGQHVECAVRKVEEYGVFLEIRGTKISGLCHKSELSDDTTTPLAQLLKSYREGDPVKAVVLSIKLDNNRISFGLKPSYFATNEDEEMESDAETEGDDVDIEMQEVADGQASSEEEEEEEVIALDDSTPTNLRASATTAKDADAPSLKLLGGFRWGVQPIDVTEQVPSDTDSSDEEGVKLKRKKRRRHEIEEDLTKDMHSKMPESSADFERLLLGSPNSSYLWIQFMSFQLQLSEIDKAREVASRALKAINLREEQEKLNVWIALLNLENSYGTAETLDATFKDAARHNDSKTIHLRLASIFVETQKFENAEQQFQKTCKKFGQSSKVWTMFVEFYLLQGRLEDARLLLPRSLKSLDKRKHLKTISKFAQLEYKHGDPERGKTIFEGIVDSHSKRLDLWSVYIDMEASQGNIHSIRNIFDRALALKLSSKKAKFLFKKWLEQEKRIGDEEGENVVKSKAIAWTQASSAGGTE